MWKKMCGGFSISSSHSISARQLCRVSSKGSWSCVQKRGAKNHLKCEKRWRGALKWSEQEKKLPCFNANTCVSCDCVGSHKASSGVGIWQFLCKYFLPPFPYLSRSRPSSHTSAWKRKSIQNSVLALVSTTSQFAFSSIAFNFFRVCSFSLSGSWRRRTGWGKESENDETGCVCSLVWMWILKYVNMARKSDQGIERRRWMEEKRAKHKFQCFTWIYTNTEFIMTFSRCSLIWFFITISLASHTPLNFSPLTPHYAVLFFFFVYAAASMAENQFKLFRIQYASCCKHKENSSIT